MNAKTPLTIVVIGSINTDMTVKSQHLPRSGETLLGGEFLMAAGGKGANQAVAAARQGGHVAMVGRVGADAFGDTAIAALKAEGIDCLHVQHDALIPSGVALINVDAKGENQIVVAPGANSSVSEEQVSAALAGLPTDSIILLQLEIPLEIVSFVIERATQQHCRVILDPAPAQDLSDNLLSKVFLLTPNKKEAEFLTGIEINDNDSAQQAARSLLSRGVQNIAITLGPQGVFLANHQGGELIRAPKANALDTTAGGDTFNGSLAAAMARGDTLKKATQYACKAAAIAVTRRGAQSSIPTQREVSGD